MFFSIGAGWHGYAPLKVEMMVEALTGRAMSRSQVVAGYVA